LGERGGRRTTSTPEPFSRSRNAAEYFESRSRMTNFLSARKPSTESVRFRPIWIIQASFGPGVTPAISSQRVASSIRKNTYNVTRPRGAQTSTVKKSAAASTSQWALRN
jgi:hypothetical protein